VTFVADFPTGAGILRHTLYDLAKQEINPVSHATLTCINTLSKKGEGEVED
jgi:hypothetical protein